jgi:SPP1 family phage portal protein
VLPFWSDSEHTRLDTAVRVYETQVYDGDTLETVEKCEVYSTEGIQYYVFDDGELVPDSTAPDQQMSYLSINGKAYNWLQIPLIAFKYNNIEQPLIERCKTLQDAVNGIMSDFENNMQEDARNTILVLKNYDGQNLGEFRRNLATYGAVKVRYDNDVKGGVEVLKVDIDSENYNALLDTLKKALIENARGFDAKDDRLGGSPNQMNIQSMYSDVDLDANGMETEFQASFESLLVFVKDHLANTGRGNYADANASIIFNRDILINETEAIENCRSSVGIISDETIISQHPWISDVALELERLERQKQAEMSDIGDYPNMKVTEESDEDT